MANTVFLARLMKMSWEIQKRKHRSRSKALTDAWAICTNEDITVFYLVKKLHGTKPMQEKAGRQFRLFDQK